MASAVQMAANPLKAQKGTGPGGKTAMRRRPFVASALRSSAAPRLDRLGGDPTKNRIVGKQSRFIE